MVGAPGSGSTLRVALVEPPMTTHPSRSTRVPSATMIVTPPMIDQAVTSTGPATSA